MNILKTAVFGAAIAVGSTTLAIAQEAEVLPITLSSVTVERYATLIETGTDGGVACCAPLVLSQPGHHLVYVRAIYDVEWTEEVDRLNVTYSDIGLQLPGDAEPRQMVGRMSAVGEFAFTGTSLNARRPRDWPEETAQAYLNAVFLVPETITTGTLVFENTTYSQEISLAAEVTELVDPASLVQISVLGLAEVDELVTSETSAQQQMVGTITPTLGEMLQLDLSVQVLQSNDIDGENSHFFRISAFSLVGPDNAPLRALGVVPSSSFQDDYSYSSRWEVGGLPNASTIRMYFAGNAAPGVYKVFYHGTPVADLLFE